MREYGKIHSSFWTSQDIRSMTEDGRTLAAYLLTSPHSNMLGCFRVPLAYVSDDLKWSLERVLKGFAELSERVWATFDKGSEWVVIHKFLKWNQPENPNVVRAAEKLFAQIPGNSGVRSILAWSIAEFEPRFSVDKLADSKPFANPFDTSLKAYRKPEPEPEPNQSQNREPTSLSLSLESDSASVEKPDAVKTIFEFWQKRMNSPRSVLDTNRRGLIERALKNYSPTDVCRAISGCAKSPHHMGDNDRKTAYNGLDLILRNSEKIEAFIRMDANPPTAQGNERVNGVLAHNDAVMAAFLAGDSSPPSDPMTIDMEH